LQRKQEEIARWWSGAELYKPQQNNLDAEDNNDQSKAVSILSKYTADYSKWEAWVPTDEATKEEEALKLKQQEDIKNEEFEKNNPDFCTQFVVDMEQRKKMTKEKEESSNILRLKGNRYFKNKDYIKASELYMEALKASPFDLKLLLNIAQAQIKLKNYEDGFEFVKRTLYLDAHNVKALSRKAFVLSELGNHGDAFEAINLALKLDPTNVELVTQQKEVAVMKQEKQSEQELQKLTAVMDTITTADKNSSTGRKSSENRKEEATTIISPERQAMQEMDRLKVLLQESIVVLKESTTSGTTSDIITTKLSALLTSLNNTLKALKSTPLVIVYLRQSEALLALITHTKALWEHWHKFNQSSSAESKTSIAVTNLFESSIFQTLALSYEILTVGIEEQRTSKQLIVDQKLYTTSKQIIETVQESTLPVCGIVLKHLYAMCKDNVCLKARLLIFGDNMTLHYLSHILGNVVYNLRQQVYTNVTPALLSKTVYPLLQDSLLIFKTWIFTDNPAEKTILTALTGSSSLPMIYSLGHVGAYFLQLASSTKPSSSSAAAGGGATSEIIFDTLQALIEILIGLSQYESLRTVFANELPIIEPQTPVNTTAASSSSSSHSKVQKKSPISLISIILDIMTRYPAHLANGLGVLMNASLEAEGTVKVAIAQKPEGMKLALSCLNIMKGKGKEKVISWQEIDVGDGLISARQAGLLSRLVGIPSIQQELMQRVNYQFLCRFLKLSCLSGSSASSSSSAVVKQSSSVTATENLPKWVIDQQLHFIRLLAALPAPTAELKALAQEEEGILASILAFFPMPRMECGEITPLSVTLVPAQPASAQLLGNAARCLMPYADDLTYASTLFHDKAYYGVEKLICAMATCVDMRVRKNIAILLAKGCRVPGVREKVSKFRGLQMMIELQDKL